MEFPWRCNVDTIAMDLKISWEMSAEMFRLPVYAIRRHCQTNLNWPTKETSVRGSGRQFTPLGQGG